MKPQKPGWYWYRDEVCGIAAAWVFVGDPAYYGEDQLVVLLPEYIDPRYVTELSGEWGAELPPPPWEPVAISQITGHNLRAP